ncbi:MAG: ABC transporter permease, partial [Phenylobacterium sp.]|nr:ABC transporter permease [Phenylobacterium sp.]
MTDLAASPRPAARGRSLTDDAIARLRANRAATLSLGVLVLL